MFKQFLLFACAVLALPQIAMAGDLSKDTKNVEVQVSQTTGHLLNWSSSDRRIKSVMVDNPEVLKKNILFNIDGCTKQRCNNASLLLISPRPGARPGLGGTIRVITYDAQNRLYPYTVTIRVTAKPQTDNETRFTILNAKRQKP